MKTAQQLDEFEKLGFELGLRGPALEAEFQRRLHRPTPPLYTGPKTDRITVDVLNHSSPRGVSHIDLAKSLFDERHGPDKVATSAHVIQAYKNLWWMGKVEGTIWPTKAKAEQFVSRLQDEIMRLVDRANPVQQVQS